MSKNKAAILLLILPILFFSGCPNPTPSSNPPAAPDNMTAAVVSATSIQLSWNDKSDNESGFEVEGGVTGGQFSLLGTTAANATQYLAIGLVPETNYSFRVRATGSDGKSAYSNTVNTATPLAAPGNLSAASTGTTSIEITWTDNCTNETGFIVERSPSSDVSDFSQITVTAPNATSYEDMGLTPNTPYWYRVKATGAAGDSAYSDIAYATTNVVPPAAPSNLTAASISTNRIDLGWTDNSDNESGFTIERSDVSGTTGFSELATPAINATSYSDTSFLNAGTTYWYRIKANGTGGSSTYSNVASAATLLASPTGLTATATGPTSIGLTWTDNSSTETGFVVERSVTSSPSGFGSLTTTAANATSYTDSTGLSANTSYWYRIKAAGPAANDSAWSSTATAKTLLQAPSGLTLTVLSTTSIKLDWTDNSGSTESGFRIERSSTSDQTGFALVTTTSANVVTYTNTGLSAGTKYWYRVRANASAGNNSLWSNVPSATTTQALPAPSGLKATETNSTSVHLAWTDNSTGETGFAIETSTASATTGFTSLTTVGTNVVTYDQTTGITPGQQRWYRVKAVGPSGNDSAYSNVPFIVTAPVDTFKVANSWGANDGAVWENVPDGFYFITYAAMKQAQVYAEFYEDRAAYNPTLLVTFEITHQKRGDLTIVVGLGNHSSPDKTKTFYSYGYSGDANAFPSNVVAFDISDFATDINNYDLFLKVTDSAANTDTGTINSFTLEKYTTYGGAKTTYTSYSTFPVSTVNGSSVFADIYTKDVVGAPSPLALSMAGQSRIANLFNSHRMTDVELSQLKQKIGVAEQGKNYNKIIRGHGTGLRPPTEAEWAQIQKTTMIVDSAKSSGLLGAVSLVDLSATKFFPPIGDQGSQGSCASWSTTYYIKTFQEALEHNRDLSTVKMNQGSWPWQPDSQQDKLCSPDFVYHQLYGGDIKNGTSFYGNAQVICNIGAASWLTYPTSSSDTTIWPSAAAWREAPPNRGNIPTSGDYGITLYYFTVTTDTEIGYLKTLLQNNIPISIAVDANQYSAMSAQDVWTETNYIPTEINHANTIVGYFDQ